MLIICYDDQCFLIPPSFRQEKIKSFLIIGAGIKQITPDSLALKVFNFQ